MNYITNYNQEVTADSLDDAIETFMEDTNRVRAYEGLDAVEVEEIFKTSPESAKIYTDWGIIEIHREVNE